MAVKILLITLGLYFANAFYIQEDPNLLQPYYSMEEANILEDNTKDSLSDYVLYPPSHVRVARQVGTTSMSSNSDGGLNIHTKFPLAENDKNMLSGVVSGQGLGDGKYESVGAGLALDNVNGHGLSLTGTHIKDLGNQLTGAGRVNLLNTDDHNLNANAFISRTFPNHPQAQNFNTYGGNLDYMFKNKVGASLGMAQTPLFQKTDYSAMGRLNLYRNPTSSIDLSAGVTKSVTPFNFDSHWAPTAGITFTKSW